jgi:ABC-2 type transport system ATP-binding protein
MMTGERDLVALPAGCDGGLQPCEDSVGNIRAMGAPCVVATDARAAFEERNAQVGTLSQQAEGHQPILQPTAHEQEVEVCAVCFHAQDLGFGLAAASPKSMSFAMPTEHARRGAKPAVPLLKVASARQAQPMAAATLITMDRVTKRYEQTVVLDGFSLEVRRGEAFGLLGPNGAGKSTLMQLMAGVLLPDAGRITLRLGEQSCDPCTPSTRMAIGLVPQELAIYPNLTAAENLKFFGSLYGLRGAELARRVRWGLGLADLGTRADARANTFSGGMQRRLNIACAVLHEPELLLLDEPTVGVDPQSRNHIFETIEALKQEGMTLIHSTHLMDEAERLCDRIAIIDHGKLLAVDTPTALVLEHVTEEVRAKPITTRVGTLEDVFLALTGKALRD